MASPNRDGLHSRWWLHPEDPWGLMIENFFPSMEEGEALTAALSDDLSFTDSLVMVISKDVSDDLRINETTLVALDVVFVDNLAINDQITQWGWSLYDNVGIQDQITQWGWSLCDNIGFHDHGFVSNISKIISDDLRIDDPIANAVARIFSDVLGIHDHSRINLIANGDMEIGNPPTGWNAGYCTIAAIDGGPTGKCLELTRTSEGWQTAYHIRSSQLVEGRTYTLSLWVKSGTSGNETFRATGDTGIPIIEGTTTENWVHHTTTFTADAQQAADNTLWLLKVSATDGTMLFDDVVLTESDPQPVFNIGKPISDDVQTNDSHIFNIQPGWSDNLSINDALAAYVTKVVSDNLNIDDVIAQLVTKILSDDIEVDGNSRLFNIGKVISDDIQVDDAKALSIQPNLSDNLSIDDSLIKYITKGLVDDLIFHDIVEFVHSMTLALYDILSVYEGSIGDLQHTSGDTHWAGLHRYFNMLESYPHWDETVETSGAWAETTRASGAWTDTVETSGDGQPY